ncbi:MAG TPA: hypothetical protein VII95_15155 [Terriglobales bacterium]|jgi:hypothetical protein
MSSSIHEVLTGGPVAGTIARRPATQLDRWWRTLFGFPVMLGVLLVGAVYVFANRSIADPDIWWHLRNAEFLVQHGSMIRHDMYSFTASGAPWINHEWLSELPYYFGWRLLGIRGLYLVLVCSVELILMGVFYLAYRVSGNVKAAFVASWFAIILATISFGPRTLLFGWIFLVVELHILQDFKEGKDRTWLLPPLFLLWVNSHGSWLIGLIFFSIFVGSGVLKGRWGRITATRWTRAQLLKLTTIFALSVLALFVNPYTYHLVFYPFDLAFQQKLNVSHVTEWQSLDFHAIRGKIVFLMLAATILLALARKRQWRLDEVGFLLFGFYATLTYTRFMFLAAIVLTPLLAVEIDFFPAYRREIDRPLLNAAIITCLVAGCVWSFPSSKYLMEDTVKDYPVKALPYLQQFAPTGRVFNDYLWGGYLIWNARQIPVFVDSRVDIFDHRGIFGDYLDAMGIKRPMEVLDKYRIQYVLYTKDTPLAYLLLQSPGWKLTYDDGTTVLFERVGNVPQVAQK